MSHKSRFVCTLHVTWVKADFYCKPQHSRFRWDYKAGLLQKAGFGLKTSCQSWPWGLFTSLKNHLITVGVLWYRVSQATEQMVVRFLKSPSAVQTWFSRGGLGKWILRGHQNTFTTSLIYSFTITASLNPKFCPCTHFYFF